MTAKLPDATQRSNNAEMPAASPSPTRLLRLPEVIKRVGLRRSAIYQRMSEGRFPKCRALGPKCSVWIEAEIDAWIEEVVRSSGRTRA
jgi:prophage regulatory protein